MITGPLHQSIARLLDLQTPLNDTLDDAALEIATEQLDLLPLHLDADEIGALISLLPANGDTAHGLNWTILHAIEASPRWPIWDLLDKDQNEWHRILLVRLANGGMTRPI